MYSSAYVWAKVLGNMESRLTPAVISTWFDDAEILELTDTKLVLYSPSSFRKDIILRRCTDYIKDAMRDEFQMEVELEVIDDTEIDAYRENQKKPDFVEFNPQFTFDKFVVGSSNRFAHRRKPITRCSSTGRLDSARRICSMPSPARSIKSTQAITSSISRATSLRTS